MICFIFELCEVIKNLLSYVKEHSNLQEKTLIAICKTCINSILRKSYNLPKIVQRNNQIHI